MQCHEIRFISPCCNHTSRDRPNIKFILDLFSIMNIFARTNQMV